MQADIPALARRLQQQKQQAAERYLANRRPNLFFQQYCRTIDRTLAELWPSFFDDGRFCLLAVGGYGRGEVYPYSDTDLTLVSAAPLDAGEEERMAGLVQTLWDLGLAPSLKAGTAAELCESARQDLTADTAFLEARFLCGNTGLAGQFIQTLNAQRHPAAFIEGKLLEMQQRHDKQQGSGALLEPNVKTCPGGLRDIHTMLWLAKAQGIDAGFDALIRQRILTRAEAGILANSHRELAAIRIDLHLAAGREEDRLIFDLQTRLAENILPDGEGGRLKSEKLMHRFYRAAKTVKQLNGIILPMLSGRVYTPLPRVERAIDRHYYQIGNQIAVRDKNLFKQQPEHIFIIIELLQQRSDLTAIAPKTLRAWWAAARKINRAFYENEANRRRFIGFFRHGRGLTRTMRFLNLYGVLGRYLPEWNKIVGLLQHDLFHIYPVDDHILTVLRNMRRLAMEQHVHELPFASAVMNAFDKKYLLYLAALFHDIAKGRGGDHAVQGVADARRFAADHFLPEEDGEMLCWLVENHLLMSMTAQKEDIQDPDVVARFCRRVQTAERLSALYLLTVADIRGTNPKLWNTWRASLLQTLYHSTAAVLNSKHHDPERLPNRREQASTDQLTRAAVPLKNQQKLRRILGSAYYVRHQTREILWHTANLAYDTQSPAVRSRILPQSNSLQVMVFMPNGDRLFARLCRIFSSHRFDIQAARAFITEHDYILDTFILQLPDNLPPEEYPDRQSALEAELNSFIHGNTTVQKQSGRPHISRRIRHIPIPPTVIITPEEDYPGWHTIDITAVNRPHLLADIAETFFAHNISLRYAKITTLDQRIEDSFITYSPSLQDPQTQNTLKQALIEVLTP